MYGLTTLLTLSAPRVRPVRMVMPTGYSITLTGKSRQFTCFKLVRTDLYICIVEVHNVLIFSKLLFTLLPVSIVLYR